MKDRTAILRGTLPRAALCAWVAAAPVAAALAQTALPPVEIIGTSPLPGQGVDRDTLPYTTQLLRRSTIDAAQADNTTVLLARRLPGVQINDVQGSPFQGDLTFRGYRASGLIGASQGLSVYLDGVRINEPFGDVVNWDMVPEFALQSMALVPGANPAFGLNTLGGALSLTTATGSSAPGLRGEFSLGSFGRKRLELSHGGQHDSGWSHYIGMGLFDETGWRDHSDGNLATVLAKIGRTTDLGDFSVSLLLGRSSLVGDGLVPLVTLGADGEQTPDIGHARREAVYTYPDLTRNRLAQLSAQWQRQLDAATRLEAVTYLRHTVRDTSNGDAADGSAGMANASFNRTTTNQRAAGLSAALSQQTGAHQVQFGAALDSARVGYEQTEQAGIFDAGRGVQPLDEAPELSARVDGRSAGLGLYATDTWQLVPGTFLTSTLRFNHARVSNTLGSVSSVSGDFEDHPRESFTYRSLNPAIGVAHKIDATTTAFVSVARNTRVPTVIELGCANPDEPCRLPAGLQSDPYLKQVRATSVETGVRFGRPGDTRGSVTLFTTANRDDILFRSVSATGQLGYFQNFPQTRHRGLDAELSGRLGPVDASLAYSFLDASYQADGVLRMGERNVVIGTGTRIAGLPRQMLKASADWQVVPTLALGADMQIFSRRGTAGNEDHLLEDGANNNVDLSLPGYGIVNLRAVWKPEAFSGLEVFARITNVTDRRYASYGALAQTNFDATGTYTGQGALALFAAPGAPRAFALGVRWTF
jgi:outer membrane cobalamin receptor